MEVAADRDAVGQEQEGRKHPDPQHFRQGLPCTATIKTCGSIIGHSLAVTAEDEVIKRGGGTRGELQQPAGGIVAQAWLVAFSAGLAAQF